MIEVDTFISVFAMKRSGHHAILYWLLNQYNEPKYFLNNRIPYIDLFCQQHNMFYDKTYLLSNEYKLSTNKKLFMINYEDFFLNLDKSKLIPNENKLLKYKKKYNIIIIRDPFNNLASRIKALRDIPKIQINISIFDSINLWKIYAKEYLGITNNINNKLNINYNKWVLNNNYRNRICKLLNLKLINDNIKCIPTEGNGSSFDEFKFQGMAVKMELFNRWKYFKDDLTYKNLFKDEELWELSYKIFGKIDGTSILKL